MAQEIVILRGIAGSGKSTYADRQAREKAATVINRDTIRRNLLGTKSLSQYWEHGMDKFLEEKITGIEHHDFAKALAEGDPLIVIDNTNLRPQYIKQYIHIMLDFGIELNQVYVEDFDIALEDAYERIRKRDEYPISLSVLEAQLRNYEKGWSLSELWEQTKLNHVVKKWYFPPFYVEPYIPDTRKTPAILCDLDGTLSHRAILNFPYPHMRSYYGVTEYETDFADPMLQPVLSALMCRRRLAKTTGEENLVPTLIFVSGRKKDTLDGTLEFLQNTFPDCKEGRDYRLLTRDENIDFHDGKHDPDDKVKYRIFNEFLRHEYNVLGVFDDRKRVIAVWEALGIRVANMGLLNEEF